MSIELPELDLAISEDQMMAFHSEKILDDYEQTLVEVETELAQFRASLANLIEQKADPLDIQAMSREIRLAESHRDALLQSGAEIRMTAQMMQTRIALILTGKR